jgi:hypothetical protein
LLLAIVVVGFQIKEATGTGEIIQFGISNGG